MDFKDCMKKRFSLRDYDSEKIVSKEIIEEIFKEVSLSPSGMNKQPWSFVVVEEEEMLTKVHNLYKRDWFKNCKQVIIAISDNENSFVRNDGKSFGEIDVTIAISYLMLACTSRNIGTCFVGNFDENKLKHILNLNDSKSIVALIPFGYENKSEIKTKKRKTVKEIVSFM